MHPIKIVKNRSDIGAGTRGSDMGIDAIEIAAINQNNDYFNRYPFLDIDTHNEAVYNKVKTSFAKRINFVRIQCERVAKALEHTLDEHYFPIVLSGDHSSALGTLSGIKAHLKNKRLGVVWIDAHADMHSPYTTPSGNVHGMPLAAALGEDNIKNQINEVTKFTKEEWERMKNIGVDGPKFLPEDLVYFGVRDTEAPEEEIRKQIGLRKYTVPEVRYKGLDNVMDEVIANFSRCDAIYISFDVDSLDCDLVSRGTGTPAAKGFDPPEVTQIINRLISTKKIACLEVSEVNPLLDDRGNKMAETAFGVLDAVTMTLEKNRNEAVGNDSI
ncbi:MAG: arginase [Ekhidna sp.]|nr:arginase [Ekhidna sp.]MBC6408938.1 arginase [Ekhidna sp.]MBC6427372.1 arginase [Ekhidna sp.]